MTITTPEPTSDLAGAAYPDLLRMGHKFVTSIGQRLIIDGFYGAMDFAFGGDGWLYVLNRFDTVNTDTYPKVRFAVCNHDDEFTNECMRGSPSDPDKYRTFPRWGCIDNHKLYKWYFIDTGLHSLSRYVDITTDTPKPEVYKNAG